MRARGWRRELDGLQTWAQVGWWARAGWCRRGMGVAVPAPAAGDGHVGTRAGLAPRLLRLALHNLPTYRFHNLVTGVTSIFTRTGGVPDP